MDTNISAPVVKETDVFFRFKNIIRKKRLNWGDIRDNDGLWSLCDDVSRTFGGLPDSLLKETLLKVLEKHRGGTGHKCTMDHLDGLIKGWKVVVSAEKNVFREGMVSASAPKYTPLTPSKRKRGMNETEKREVMKANSMAQFLKRARLQINEAEASMDFNEDDSGNFMIDGEHLSFENWGKICKQQEDPKPVVKKAVALPVSPYVAFQQAKKERTQHNEEQPKLREEARIRTMRAGLTIEDEMNAISLNSSKVA
ncbi:hypothetical protein L596_001176 [Steinernema carpocapsae]|uniref:Uncharacterized protein n=1 Tax=Steinernema carpocapsae TaxID=34508 RepID=A0A4U8UKH7_STECR|nr:hypothetical protein L596_001176 [Steinernema carpocapsae]